VMAIMMVTTRPVYLYQYLEGRSASAVLISADTYGGKCVV
jgi:hypothetical protein